MTEYKATLSIGDKSEDKAVAAWVKELKRGKNLVLTNSCTAA